jgi:hypothetical protein
MRRVIGARGVSRTEARVNEKLQVVAAQLILQVPGGPVHALLHLAQLALQLALLIDQRPQALCDGDGIGLFSARVTLVWGIEMRQPGGELGGKGLYGVDRIVGCLRPR